MRAADLVRLVPSAQRIARRYARDGSEAQDLSQELLLKLLQLDSDPRTPIAYMHVVTRRLAAQLRERERREAQVAVESRRIRPPGGGGGCTAGSPPSPSAAPTTRSQTIDALGSRVHISRDRRSARLSILQRRQARPTSEATPGRYNGVASRAQVFMTCRCRPTRARMSEVGVTKPHPDASL